MLSWPPPPVLCLMCPGAAPMTSACDTKHLFGAHAGHHSTVLVSSWRKKAICNSESPHLPPPRPDQLEAPRRLPGDATQHGLQSRMHKEVRAAMSWI